MAKTSNARKGVTASARRRRAYRVAFTSLSAAAMGLARVGSLLPATAAEATGRPSANFVLPLQDDLPKCLSFPLTLTADRYELRGETPAVLTGGSRGSVTATFFGMVIETGFGPCNIDLILIPPLFSKGAIDFAGGIGRGDHPPPPSTFAFTLPNRPVDCPSATITLTPDGGTLRGHVAAIGEQSEPAAVKASGTSSGIQIVIGTGDCSINFHIAAKRRDS